MAHQVKGLKDIYAILANERKLGGVIETCDPGKSIPMPLLRMLM